MARRHLEAGGDVTPATGGGDDDGVLLPADVDPGAVVAAMAAAFGAGIDRRRLAADALVRRRNSLVVRRDYVRRLGDGDFASGKRLLMRLIDDQRRRR